MMFLAPALLALALAVAVPLVLHLLQRHQGPRMVFPALRYLRRAEREHATRIRLRQLLLLALRVLAILLLAAAAAQPFLRGAGQGHPPTSVVLVLDNSLSTSAVTGDRRVLDDLRSGALQTLTAMGPGDRVWLLRAGSPWEPAITGDAAAVAEAVRRTQSSGGRADLTAGVQRAAAILALESPEREKEIHLLSDLQASALTRLAGTATEGVEAPPVVIYEPDSVPPENRAVAAVEVNGGLAPRAGQRSTVAVTLTGTAGADSVASTDSVAVRLVLDGSVRAAGWARPGSGLVLPFPARPAGQVAGFVEIDPDPLLTDNRSYFVVDVAAAPAVAVSRSQPFLEEVARVLENAGRIQRASVGEANVVIAPGGRGAEAVRTGAAAVVILPPASALELAATNQRLASAAIPWRYGPPQMGQARLDTTTSALARGLGEIRLHQRYPLLGQESGGAGNETAPIRLRDGTPWAVSGQVPGGGRYLMLGSPMTVEGGTLPTSAAMVPFLDRVISGWASGASGTGSLGPGAVVAVAGDSVAGPDGAESIAGASVHRLGGPGIYRVLSGGQTVAVHAVNAPAGESRLERATRDQIADRLSPAEVTVASPADWDDVIFRDRIGRDLSPWLLLAALLLLVVESAIAATGRIRRPSRPGAAPAEHGITPAEAR